MIKPFHILTTKWLSLLVGLLAVLSLPLQAQIYEPDGLRMPGDWNQWENAPGMGGNFELHKISTGTPHWTTTFQYTGNTGPQEFKFVSTSFSDPWGNQWAANQNIAVNQENNFTYGTPSDPNNRINVQQNFWYTVVWKDSGYENTTAVFMETATEPTAITQVSQDPAIVAAQDEVQVTALLAANPDDTEHFYLRYSTDGFATSTVLSMSVESLSAVATIPGQASNTTVSYFVFSSTLSDPTADFDLYTLKINDNNGNNFSYIVDQTFDCDSHESLVSSEPAFPLENQSVTIFFNAAYGNGGLYNYAGDIYAHTGVITNLSVNSSDWKYVKTQWGENTPETKLERITANLYSLTIDNIRTYYGVPAAEQIEKLSFVFRSDEETPEGYYLEHKNADGSDIFVEVYTLSLNVKIINPNRKEPLVSPNAVLPVCVEALENTSVSLYLDNILLQTDNATSLSYPLLALDLPAGVHWIKAVATDGTDQVRDSVQIYLRGPVQVAELPEGMKNGVNYLSANSVTLVLNDPAGLKEFAFAIGDFSNWLPNDENYMKRTPDGKHYWVTLNNLTAGEEYAYQYFIDGTMKLADAYADKILDPWNDRWIPTTTYPDLKAYPFDKTIGVVSVFETDRADYDWQIEDFTPPAVNETQSDLLVYELLLRDFSDEQTINEVTAKLDYLKNTGVNAIQLMPIAEFDGNESWGYSPNFFFAPDKYYGTENAYKAFVDAAHAHDIAVILDIVPNHAFGQCPMVQMYFDPNAGDYGQPSAQNPWFNPVARHPYSVGYDFNHESPSTRAFFKEVFEYWLTEFKIDGFRFDLSKGLTQTYSGDDVGAWSQYDQSRINILTDYYNHIKSVKPNAYVILEHFANNDEETVLANTGMMLWSGMHSTYKQLAMGWSDNSDFSWAYHGSRGWNYPNLMDYMENHDEERMMADALAYGNASGDYNIKDSATAIRHQEQAIVLFMGVPGPKMLWMFQEQGYDYSINYGGDRLAPKPARWDYLNMAEREHLNRVVGGMAALRKSDAFRYGSFSKDLAGNGKRIWITHNSIDVVIAANMGVTAFDMSPGFTKTGTWYNYFTGESINVTDVNQSFSFGPGDYRVFTSVQLPRPFYQLQVKVVEKLTGLSLAGVSVTLDGLASRTTDANGLGVFTAVPGSFDIAASKFGWLPKTGTGSLGNDQLLTIELERDLSSLPADVSAKKIRCYPNPTKGLLNIENANGYQLVIYNLQGRMMLQTTVNQEVKQLSIDKFPAGVYLLHLQNGHKQQLERLIVN